MKQKLFHLSKRKELPWYCAWGIRGAAILLALVVCGFVTTAMTGENPIAIYKTMFSGPFRTLRTTGTPCNTSLCCSASPWR